MNPTDAFRAMNRRDLRGLVDELYADYVGCLDDGDFERWPEFFTERCSYRIVPRENHDRGLPLATWVSGSARVYDAPPVGGARTIA